MPVHFIPAADGTMQIAADQPQVHVDTTPLDVISVISSLFTPEWGFTQLFQKWLVGAPFTPPAVTMPLGAVAQSVLPGKRELLLAYHRAFGNPAGFMVCGGTYQVRERKPTVFITGPNDLDLVLPSGDYAASAGEVFPPVHVKWTGSAGVYFDSPAAAATKAHFPKKFAGAPHTYSITATVTDGEGMTAAGSYNVTVGASDPTGADNPHVPQGKGQAHGSGV